MNNPWRGLASYKDPLYSKTPYLFCGRDKEIAEVTKYIDNNLFVTLYGRTGIGKTSLLNAGVFPLLRMRNYYPIYIRLSQKPKDYTYAQYVIEKIEGSDLKIRHAEIDNSALNNDSAFLLWNYFYTTKFYNGQDIEVYPVIVLDQFEEIFMMSKDESLLLLTQINTLLSDNYDIPEISGCSYETNYRFVASIREDNLYCLEDAIDELGLACLKENRYRLRPLSQANAKSVVLQPGCNCLRSEEADDIAEKAIELSKDNDGSVSSLILSLICSIMFERAKLQNQSAPMIKTAMLPANQKDTDEILCDFYLHHTTKKQRKVIEEELLTSDGHRKCSNVSIPNEEELLSNETRILLKVETNEGTQTEIVHDRMAKVIYMNRRKQDSDKFRGLLRLIIMFFLLSFFGIAIVMSWTSSNKSPKNYPFTVDTNRGIKSNTLTRSMVLNDDSVHLYIGADSKIDTIYLGEKVSNVDSLIIEKRNIVFEILPKNKIFKWDYFWDSFYGVVGYLTDVNTPSVALYSQKDMSYYHYGKFYRLPAGIDRIQFGNKVIEHKGTLPRYGVKHAIIDNQSALEYYRYDDKIESITITRPVKIESFWFNDMTNIRKVVFTTDTSTVDKGVFMKCENLTEVRLPKVLLGDVEWLFFNCFNLSTITLPDEMDCAKRTMFQFCPNINNITLSKDSKFEFSSDSILYYNETAMYLNLCKNKYWQNKGDTIVDKKDKYTSIRYGIVSDSIDVINIISHCRNYNTLWTKGQDYWYFEGCFDAQNVVAIENNIEQLHLPIPSHSSSHKYMVTGLTSSIKEIHTHIADPTTFFLNIRGINKVKTLYVPYGCGERYILSGLFKGYTIKEDPWYIRASDTIEYYAQNATLVFRNNPIIYYGLTLIGLVLLFSIYYILRRKQMIANGEMSNSQCVNAGLFGIFIAFVGFIPIYYVIYVALTNHVDDTNENVNEIIASVFGVMSSVICSYIFIFAGKGKIWNRWKDIIKRGL